MENKNCTLQWDLNPKSTFWTQLHKHPNCSTKLYHKRIRKCVLTTFNFKLPCNWASVPPTQSQVFVRYTGLALFGFFCEIIIIIKFIFYGMAYVFGIKPILRLTLAPLTPQVLFVFFFFHQMFSLISLRYGLDLFFSLKTKNKPNQSTTCMLLIDIHWAGWRTSIILN